MSPSLPSRRGVLGGLGALAVAGGFGLAAAGSGASALTSDAEVRVRYWNLFSGGDGANMIAMLDAFRAANPGIDVKDSTLQWGNPYYTKLAMAASGSRTPDLGVMHLGRIAGFAPGRLLDPFDVELLAQYGVHERDFNPALWKRAVVDGELYALPLDIHPQVSFYRKDVCEKAGLIIDGAGRWRVFFTIVLPLSRPSLSAVGIFTFIASWNNFLWPYMVTNNPDLMTMPNGIATVMNSYGIQWAQLMAGGLMAGLPLVVVFVFFQRQIVSGVAHTGLAGQ